MNRVTAAMVRRGERRIAERRAEVAQAAVDVRRLISDLIDTRERLTAENRRLTRICVDQQRLLDRAEPLRSTRDEAAQ